MPPILRTIQNPLGESAKKKLRKWWKEQNNLQRQPQEKTIMENLGYDNLRDTYYHLADLYNDYVANERNRRARERRHIRQEAESFLNSIANAVTPAQAYRIRRYPRIVFRELGKYIEWNNRSIGENTPFELTLQSGIADVQHVWKFKNMHHFRNWYSKTSEQQMVSTSDSQTVSYHLENVEIQDVFSGLVIVKNLKQISGGCNKHKAGEKKLKSSFYNYTLHNPTSMDNNCLFACLAYIMNEKLNIRQLRKQFGIPTGEEVTVAKAYEIFQHLNVDVKIIDYETNEELNPNQKYIVLKDSHYYVVEKIESIVKKGNKTKRGNLTFDLETRPTEEYHLIKASNTKSYILKDTLCCAYYNKYKSTEQQSLKFVTDNEKSSIRQFVDWLNQESKENRTYNIIAHNGGNFDFYFFISCLTPKELLDCDISMRGTTLIGINYRGNLFKDSYCFLINSLENLSSSFGVTHGKITEINLHGNKLTSAQLCFYKPQLKFQEFLDLQNNDPEFWMEYEKYCLYDCIALAEIWKKFTENVNKLVETINPYLLRSCPLMSSNTIGSHSKKILVELNKVNGKVNYKKRDLALFTGITYEKDEIKVDFEKYQFLTNFKRGGISHCNQAGKHTSGTTGVDIASQYPASLLYAYIPTGKSEWVTTYDETKHGFYLLKNLKFETEYLFKPVAQKGLTSLNWATNDMDELYVDSYMLKYVIDNYGLTDFTVEKGLVSNKQIIASELFGKYINTFYEEKKRQDDLKTKKDKSYNPALRETIKLYLNSLTGKLVENPSIHYSLVLNKTPETVQSTHTINGVGATKEFHQDKVNDWIVAGIMVYSYSKRLLFEYIKCLPNNSNDVIHVETDGIYFSTQHLPAFTTNLENYKGDYPCMFGENLGNLKIEKSTPEGSLSYFLGKKFYCIVIDDSYVTKARDTSDKNIYRVKGIPQTTIEDDGTKKFLVDIQLYDDIYNGTSLTRTFATLRKSLFAQHTQISSHKLTRVIRPNCKYNLYN